MTMIDLGLARIARLLRYTPQTWRTIHVAGTNGKGSICAYLSAMLHATGSTCARFTSPHLIDRWDCITINEQPVSVAAFLDAEALVRKRDAADGVGATPFELLAATAFELFHREEVEYGVVEVGLGGKLDATNALEAKVATAVAKIGLDHQSFLGNTLEEIALHKAGIMRKGVPCVVDNTNEPSVLRVVGGHGREVGADVSYISATPTLNNILAGQGFEPHQVQNVVMAYETLKLARPDKTPSLTELLPIIKQVKWPGRLHLLDIGKITGREQPVLLDGAHNRQSAEVLSAYVEKHLRPQGEEDCVTWVLAASAGRDLQHIYKVLLKPGDQVYAVSFRSVDGMPWVEPATATTILEAAGSVGIDEKHQYAGGTNLKSTLCSAAEKAGSGPTVIAGSLYLVSDVLRLLRET